ncbi:MAG TPA: TolC family protein [Candidatus Binatia bacterium]|nr:TolC family protein [Candidatus Binatia bacterium]
MSCCRRSAVFVCWALFVSGCAGLDLQSGFSDVSSNVQERLAVPIFWNNGTDLDCEASDRRRKLLSEKITADEAVQIALLNNRELQAVYSELGVAQADLVQAGLLSNPIFDAAIKFPTSGRNSPDLELGAAMNFLNIFYIPLRKRVAAARFEEAKTRVTGAVLDFAGRVRRAFYAYEADEQMLDLRHTVVQALSASFAIAGRLHQAGNISDLDFFSQRAQLEAGRLALRAAEISVRQSREELNSLMGLWGSDLEWQSTERLPDIPNAPLETKDIERVAIERSLDLAQARQRIIGTGEELGLTRWTTLLPDFSAGPHSERNDGTWEVGPKLDFLIPLFDQGQARLGRTAAELRRLQQEYYDLAVRIRSRARQVRDRVEGATDRAMYYRDILLPLHERIVNEAQLQYNAMQLGPLQLIRAREQQIETAVSYIAALRDYWLARAELEQMLTGSLPSSTMLPSRAATSPSGSSVSEGH